MVYEGTAILCTVMGMHRKTWALVHQQDVLIFIYDIQFGCGNCQIGIVLPGFVEKLIIDVQLQHIARLQPHIPLCPAPIALDPLDTDIFLGQRCRKQRNSLGKKAVKPLPCIIISYSKFLHNAPIKYSYRFPGQNAGRSAG